jgi:hypothetical protein
MHFSGEFETHLTVRLDDAADVERLRAWARPRELKCTHIVLARGDAASQPMVTRHGRGDLATEQAAAKELADELSAAGFEVTRIKIEAALWTAGVPATDDDGQRQPREGYFEHHVKLLLDADADVTVLTHMAQEHAAHVSRNVLRRRDDGREERFVTQRCFGVGRITARAALDALLHAVRRAEYAIIDVEEEFVVHDSNLTLDAGWIEFT